MRGDPFRHSPIAAERCETRLKNAPGRCAPGRPPSSLPRPSASHPPRIRRSSVRVRRRLMAKYSFLSTSHSYFITPFSALSTNAGYARPRHTHSRARRFNALSALFYPILPGTEKAPGLHALARGSVAGNRYHPATYPDGVDRSGISPTCGKDRGNLQGRKAFSATTHELLDALRNRRFTVGAARAVFYIRGRSSDRMTRRGPLLPGEPSPLSSCRAAASRENKTLCITLLSGAGSGGGLACATVCLYAVSYRAVFQ